MKTLIVPLILVSGMASLSGAGDPDPFAGLRSLEPPDARPESFPDGEFDLPPGSTMAFLGGTGMLVEERTGYLETLLHQAYPDSGLQIRNVAWSADTVFRMQRDLYFYDAEHSDKQPGSTPDQRQRVQADVIVAQFGQMEVLENPEGFAEAFEQVVTRLKSITPRIVILTPVPFVNSGPAGELAEDRNLALSGMVEKIHAVAGEQELLVVDLFASLTSEARAATGIHLSEESHLEAARLTVEKLAGTSPGELDEELRTAVLEKNQLWNQYYRPTNWAFLYGDRQHVPSSRDHEDPEKRWFPHELERVIPLIDELESAIHETASN